MSKLKEGDPAPDFVARTSEGGEFRLSDCRGKTGLVLFFYPKDGTRICTAEACAFRDSYQKFRDAGFEVAGVSSDSHESHVGFATQNQLQFPLLADEDGSLRRRFGVPKVLGLLPGRVTYVINREGIVCSIFSAAFASDEHVQHALSAVAQSKAQHGPGL